MGSSHLDAPLTTALSLSTRRRRFNDRAFLLLAFLTLGVYFLARNAQSYLPLPSSFSTRRYLSSRLVDPDVWQANVDRCNAISVPSGPPKDFASRSISDRAGPSTNPLLIRNVTLWTGERTSADRTDPGLVRNNVDVYLEGGLIKSIAESGKLDPRLFNSPSGSKPSVIDGKGRWMTPGIIDVHVHVGVDHLPELHSVQDTNSHESPRTPSLRSLDGMNSHDISWVRVASGGITSGLVLPGSGNNMGGQAFPVKLGRQTEEDAKQGSWKRIIDPPKSLVLPGEGNVGRPYPKETGMLRDDGSSSWRYMKNACGENARRWFGITRMDEARGFRGVFWNARELKKKQDAFCSKTLGLAKQGIRPSLAEAEDFPDDLELEAVVDVLRGKVKVNTHCYTTTDLESYVRHSNEFQFPVAAFHHAHETYLVPDLLKQMYGGPPAVALFSLNANYKMEAYFGSPFAPVILSDANLTVLHKSDHPVTDSRRLVAQAAQSHHFGLPVGETLRSITTNAAEALGLDHRIGYAKEGHDADLVLWDDHPLALGASPLQVLIDGVPQLDASWAKSEPSTSPVAAEAPKSGAYEAEISRVKNQSSTIISWEEQNTFPVTRRTHLQNVAFRNVGRIFQRTGKGKGKGGEVVELEVGAGLQQGETIVLVEGGNITCAGSCVLPRDKKAVIVDLKGGSIIPGLTAYGPDVGQSDLTSEPSTGDGFAPARSSFAALFPGRGESSEPFARAVDGLQWGGNDVRRAHSMGVRTGIVAPRQRGFVAGLSAHFDLGVDHALDQGAVRKEEVAMHVRLDHWQDGESDKKVLAEGEQLAALRRLLRGGSQHRRRRHPSSPSSLNGHDEVEVEGEDEDEAKAVWSRVARGDLPLVVSTTRAERIASLIKLKSEHPKLRLVLADAAEASLFGLPSHLAKAGVAVLLRPQVWPRTWDEKRALAGPPLTKSTVLSELLDHGVRVGLITEEAWQGTTLLWETVQAAKEAGGLKEEKILNLVTSAIDDIFGLESPANSDFVAYDGNPFEYGARVVAIGTPRGTEIM